MVKSKEKLKIQNVKNIKIYKNKSIYNITNVNTKSKNKNENEPDSRCRERNGGEEQLEPGGKKENYRN
jgi:hypothetical protein